MSGKKWNRRMYRYDKGIPVPRVYHHKARGKKSARYLVKCGDCDSSLEIYYGSKGDDTLEIGGVLASKKEWQKILIPLLR